MIGAGLPSRAMQVKLEAVCNCTSTTGPPTIVTDDGGTEITTKYFSVII